jgi:hypothetical protein
VFLYRNWVKSTIEQRPALSEQTTSLLCTPAPAPLQTTFTGQTQMLDVNNIWIYQQFLDDNAIASSSPFSGPVTKDTGQLLYITQ